MQFILLEPGQEPGFWPWCRICKAKGEGHYEVRTEREVLTELFGEEPPR